MSFAEVHNVSIAGIAAGVPKRIIKNQEYSEKYSSAGYDIIAFIESTGVAERRVSQNHTTSDLGIPAAEKLISDLKWDKNSIEAILFVSQTADYILPATACIIQDRLGLPTSCYALDISLGCSGWVYGVHMLASLISASRGKTFRRALLFAGDSIGRVHQDHPLFGAACTVTALEYKRSVKSMRFDFGTDGSGYNAIIIPDGGCRNGITPKSFDTYKYDGHTYNRLQTQMNGIDVFSFGISTVPKSITSLATHYKFDYLDFDYYVFHQANLSMNNTICRKLKLNQDKVPMSIQSFGNTSSASIPLTIVTQLKGKIEKTPTKLICCGFGVGLSWGTLAYESDNVILSDLVEIE